MHRIKSPTAIRPESLKIHTLSRLLCLLLSFGCCASAQAADAEPAEIIVRDLEDISFGVVPPTVGELRAESAFCVAMEPRGRYSLIGRGDGPSGGFEIIETGNGIHSIAYSVFINDRGQSAGSPLRPGVALNNLRASRLIQSGRCVPAAQIRVIVSGSEIQQANPGRYEGTFSLTVVPE